LYAAQINMQSSAPSVCCLFSLDLILYFSDGL
jgi:hypothetical protein